MCRGAFEREIGFSKTRALRKRERERQTLDVVSDLPLKGKKRERRPTLDLTHYEKKCTKREEKKTNRQPKHNISKKERERAFEEKERERERVFFKRKERHFSSFLSLLSLSSPEGGAS